MIFGTAAAQRAGTPIVGLTPIAHLRAQAHFKRISDPPLWASRRLALKPEGYRARRDAFADELDARADRMVLILLGRCE